MRIIGGGVNRRFSLPYDFCAAVVEVYQSVWRNQISKDSSHSPDVCQHCTVFSTVAERSSPPSADSMARRIRSCLSLGAGIFPVCLLIAAVDGGIWTGIAAPTTGSIERITADGSVARLRAIKSLSVDDHNGSRKPEELVPSNGVTSLKLGTMASCKVWFVELWKGLIEGSDGNHELVEDRPVGIIGTAEGPRCREAASNSEVMLLPFICPCGAEYTSLVRFVSHNPTSGRLVVWRTQATNSLLPVKKFGRLFDA